MRRIGPLVALGTLLFLCACQNPPWRKHCPVPLAPSETVARGTVRRLRVEFETGDREVAYDAVVERQEDGALMWIGLTPFGTRAFSVIQRGTEFWVDNKVGKHVGMRPRQLLDAMHRAELIAPFAPGPGDGSRWFEREGERVVDTWEDGSRKERTYAAASVPNAPATRPAVHILYSGDPGGPIRIDNDWCDYEARLLILP